MADNQATILIPDISGYTEFMTKTDLLHGTHLINSLINTIVEAVADEYEVSEIEGDAVLLVRKGAAPTQQEILDICLKIFNAFHFERKFMQKHVICPCGSCQSLINLTLKFVVHRGPLAEIKVGKFVKHSGPEMIVAHRLLKNSIDSNEYLLFTEKLLEHTAPASLNPQLQWFNARDEYASIGAVDYRFALLDEARKSIPDPPLPDQYYPSNDDSFTETNIAADFRDVYMLLMNIAERAEWVPGLLAVSQEASHPYVGSEHTLQYENYEAIVSPVKMDVNDEGIAYVESCTIPARETTMMYEFVFRNTGNKNCQLACRIVPAGDTALPEEMIEYLTIDLDRLTKSLKQKAESIQESFFEPIEPCE